MNANKKPITKKIQDALEILNKMSILHLMPKGEVACLYETLKGEEGEAIAEVIQNVWDAVQKTPAIYSQEKVKDPMVCLHWFTGGWDWYATEREPELSVDLECFGYVKSPDFPELGYFPVKSITSAGAELDLYWTPKPLSECKKG